MLKKSIRSIGVMLAFLLLLGSFTVALAYVKNTNCSFAVFDAWHYNSNSQADGPDTATSRSTLTHVDANGKYWGTVSVTTSISGVKNDGVTPYTVYGATVTTNNPSSGYVRTTTEALTPWARSSHSTLTAHCRHNNACAAMNQCKVYLNESW